MRSEQPKPAVEFVVPDPSAAGELVAEVVGAQRRLIKRKFGIELRGRKNYTLQPGIIIDVHMDSVDDGAQRVRISVPK